MRTLLSILVVFLFLFPLPTAVGDEKAPLIRDIKISGHYPFLTKQVLRLLSLQPGDPYDSDKIEENKNRLKEFFEKRGNYDTEIRIEALSDPHYPAINLYVHINKGPTYRIGEVTIDGNDHFSQKYLKNKFPSWTRFSQKKLTRQLKKIQKKYIKDGFVRARIEETQTSFNQEERTVDLSLSVEEKKRLAVYFTGNHWFEDTTLKNYVTFYRDRSYSAFEVERSLEHLRDFYLRNGFPQMSVHAETEKSEDSVKIHFEIFEGPRTRTKQIKIANNKEISDKQLKSNMALQEHTLTHQGLYDERLLLDDPPRLKKLYETEGYLDAQILEVSQSLNKFGDQMSVNIKVDEGRGYILKNVHFSGNSVFKASELFRKSNLSLKHILTLQDKNKAYEKILNAYFKAGHPYVSLSFDENRNDEKAEIDLNITIDEGPPARFGTISIEGNFITQPKTILSALKFKEGDVYRYEKVLTGQLNLKRLGIFDYVSITPVGQEEKREVLDVIVKLTERKDKTLDIQAGFDSDKLATGQLIFTKRNLFGLGKQLQLRGVGGFEFDRGELTLLSPRLFGASWNLANQYFIEYKDQENYNAWSYGGSIGTLKSYGQDWTLLLKTQITRFNIFEDQSNQKAFADNLFDSTFSETSVSMLYDTRDNFSDPSRGIYSLLSTEFDTDLADLSNNFNITKFNIAHYQGFLGRFTFINNFRVGKLFELAQEPRIPASKLFFQGGNDTIRGFDEDVVVPGGGTTSLLYNAELDFQIFGGIKLAGFFDTGSLTATFSDITKDSFRESAGFGLRYMTPVGPIRLDYGFVLDKRDDEKSSRFHFSFGGMF